MVREEIKRGIERYLKIKYAKRIEDAEDFEIFNALSLTIMEEIIDQWNDTKELLEKEEWYNCLMIGNCMEGTKKGKVDIYTKYDINIYERNNLI